MSSPIYGLYDPEGDGITLYQTENQRNRAAKEAIESYLDDREWSEGVDGIYGFVVTHRTSEIDRKDRPTVDEDGLDEDGQYWPPGIDYHCNYALAKIERHPKEPKPDA